MRKIIVLLILVMTTPNVLAQDQAQKNSSYESREKKQINSTIYQLFPTQNKWTFIKLNTRNGQMWQVQYGLEDGSNLVTDLNSISLVTGEKERDGRFTLYPTKYMEFHFTRSS